MFLKILINFLFGYLNVEVEGYYVERLIIVLAKIFSFGKWKEVNQL